MGYEVNKVSKYRLQFGARTLIGAFPVVFSQRHHYICRAITDLGCFALRKRSWD